MTSILWANSREMALEKKSLNAFDAEYGLRKSRGRWPAMEERLMMAERCARCSMPAGPAAAAKTNVNTNKE